jgi:hypothetical protein
MSLQTLPKRIVGALALALLGLVLVVPPAQAAGPGHISITNPDLVPGNNSIIFNRIQYPADTYQRVHDKVSVRLTNDGSTSATVNSVTTTGPFTATKPVTIPTTLAAGSHIDILVTFTATSGPWSSGTLVVKSTPSGGAATTSTVALNGYWQILSEHNIEPWLPDLVKKLGYKTVMPTSIFSKGEYKAFSTDEVLSPYWTRLDTSKTSAVTQLATWRGYPTTATLKWFPKGSTASTSTVITALRVDAQSVLPRTSTYAPGRASFTPTGTFGFKLDAEYTDPKLNNASGDRSAGCTATQCGQHVRVFKVRDSAGNVVPGRYLFCMDIGGINFDYQDSVYLVTNLKPAA